MTPIACITDLQQLARRRLPRVLYDYVQGGSWSESACRRNESDFDTIRLRQRVGRAVAQRTTECRMLGQTAALPLALAPTGLAGLLHGDGEILAARAAATAGVPFTLSTMSICSIEDVAAASSVPFWFQLYLFRDRAFVARLIERARAAACPVLVLTMDLQAQGPRYRDIRNRLAVPLRLSPRALLDMACRPRWCASLLRTRRRRFGNLLEAMAGTTSLRGLAAWTAQQFEPALNWDDVAWVRQRWPYRLVLKGILDREDARQAVQLGADGIIVSNHGGRQLDAAASSIAALDAISDAVGARTEVYLDGGVRDGQDILRTLALGARGVFVGRPFLYGLAALGEPGVQECIRIFRRDLHLAMAFCALRSIDEVSRDIVFNPAASIDAG